MTLISAISNIGSVSNKNTTSSMISNKSSSSSISFDSNQSASLLDTDIMANLLGILGIHIKAKVL